MGHKKQDFLIIRLCWLKSLWNRFIIFTNLRKIRSKLRRKLNRINLLLKRSISCSLDLWFRKIKNFCCPSMLPWKNSQLPRLRNHCSRIPRSVEVTLLQKQGALPQFNNNLNCQTYRILRITTFLWHKITTLLTMVNKKSTKEW